MRELFAPHLLAMDCGVSRASAHGRIITADYDTAAIDTAGAEYEVGGPELNQLAIFVFGRACKRTVFVKRARIEQTINTLAHREFATVVLTLDVLRTPHLPSEFGPPSNLVQFVFPGHIVSPANPSA